MWNFSTMLNNQGLCRGGLILINIATLASTPLKSDQKQVASGVKHCYKNLPISDPKLPAGVTTLPDNNVRNSMQSLSVPPSLGLTMSEIPRAGVETLQMLGRLRFLIQKHQGDGHPVLVLPGYGGADGSTAVMRYFLGKIGYTPFPLQLGRNLEQAEDRIRSVDDATRFREGMVSEVVRRIDEIHQQTGEQVSLVGWSMGGLYALDASHETPHQLRQIITLGSPFGDPRGTSLFNAMRKFSGSKVDIESQDFDSWLSKARGSQVPTHIIYSKKDGIVGTDIARLPEAKNVHHRHLPSSHIAFALNPRALDMVAKLLRK